MLLSQRQVTCQALSRNGARFSRRRSGSQKLTDQTTVVNFFLANQFAEKVGLFHASYFRLRRKMNSGTLLKTSSKGGLWPPQIPPLSRDNFNSSCTTCAAKPSCAKHATGSTKTISQTPLKKVCASLRSVRKRARTS